MKHISKLMVMILALCLLLSVSALAASGEPSGEPSAEPAPVAGGPESTANMTVSEYGTLNNFRRDDSGYITIGYDVVDGQLTANSNWATADHTNIVLDNEVEGPAFTAVRAVGEGSVVTVTGSLSLSDDTAGEHASDFSGVGAAFNVANYAVMNINNVDLVTDGFVRAALILDNYCVSWVKDSSFVTYGADPLTEAYDGYANSATTSKMLSPPWVLGIQGGIRTINVLDNQATLVVEDSYLASGGWGVISTDGCTGPVIYVIDSELEILPESEGGMNSGYEVFGFDPDAYGSGYGAYIIGKVDEQNYGVEINGTTFAAICREGDVSYQSSNGVIDVIAATGESLGTVEGEGKVSVINSVFGAQTHSSEDVSISYLDGTIVNSEMATILYRSSGHAVFTVDEAELNPGNGIILQMIDDDDSTVGMGDFSTMGFNTHLYEDAGRPSQNGNETGKTENNENVIMTLTNGEYEGDFYNGTGYYGQAGDVLDLTIGAGATLNGAVALTETMHGLAYSEEAIAALDKLEEVEYVLLDADCNVLGGGASGEPSGEPAGDPAWIQITQFSINEYYLLCQLFNNIYWNGYSAINVNVDGGIWTVTDESLITALNINGGVVVGEIIENADGTITILPGSDVYTEGAWGEIIEANVAASGEMGMGNAGGGSDEPAGAASGEPSAEPAAPAAAAAGGVTWADYQEYLIENAGKNAPDLEEFKAQVYAIESWEALDQTVSPWDQMFTTIGMSTWEEFQAGSAKGSLVEGAMA